MTILGQLPSMARVADEQAQVPDGKHVRVTQLVQPQWIVLVGSKLEPLKDPFFNIR